MSATSSYNGATTVSGGTLSIFFDSSNPGKLSNTSSITVNSGGTLLLSGTVGSADRINNSATMTLNGGKFNTGGLSETLGALTLQASSIIDLGAGASILHFADSHLASWTAAQILEIDNWSGLAVRRRH